MKRHNAYSRNLLLALALITLVGSVPTALRLFKGVAEKTAIHGGLKTGAPNRTAPLPTSPPRS